MKSMLESVRTYLENSNFPIEQGETVDYILDAMKKADRRFFIDESPYADSAIPIGEGQTISQPSTVAAILRFAALSSGSSVLEIGAGSGWNAAVTGFMVYPGEVTAAEIIPELAEKAERNIESLKSHFEENGIEFRCRVRIIPSDILSKEEQIPALFDRIIFSAGIRESEEERIEKFALKNLEDGGVLVCPQRRGPLIKIEKRGAEIIKTKSEEQYVFVPLIF
ncbi:MAG: protein-L-isoaspartate O-methyltransferase family protein [Fibrobacterota bacterium]